MLYLMNLYLWIYIYTYIYVYIFDSSGPLQPMSFLVPQTPLAGPRRSKCFSKPEPTWWSVRMRQRQLSAIVLDRWRGVNMEDPPKHGVSQLLVRGSTGLKAKRCLRAGSWFRQGSMPTKRILACQNVPHIITGAFSGLNPLSFPCWHCKPWVLRGICKSLPS